MPTPTYTPLANLTLSGSASTVTFSSISGAYRDLVLVANASSAASNSYLIRINGDTAANYYNVVMDADGTTATSGAGSNTSLFSTSNINSITTTRSVLIHNFLDYTATDRHKPVLGRVNNSTLGVAAMAGRWANTSAITTIELRTFSSTFAAGSTFALYGVIA